MDTMLWFIGKVICVKGCSNSYDLWKFYMIGTFYFEVVSTYSTTPPEPLRPGAKYLKHPIN